MSRWSDVESLFDRLRDLPPTERRTILESHDDAETVVEVVSLLNAHDEAEGFLDDPAFVHPDVSEEQWTADLVERERIGPYRITGVLGAGGMGVVLAARQEHPDRAVALKLLRSGPWTSDRHVRLFHREVEALARLEHPDIARVHDAGTTDDGQHWFSMELVRGVPLDAFVAGRELSRCACLELFRRVCAAVGYAHQRGVIHCDLKPSNILVAGTADGYALKILDFGLARIMRHEDPEDAVTSRPGGIQGSLAWMSPEQARGDDDAIDVRADVYALGVILHQLLSGSFPYDLEGLAPHEAVNVICDQAPAPLPAGTPTDLVTIRTKALEKEVARRYEGAFELAEDVRRWLDREPILARPPTTAYRLTRTIQRHRFAVAAIATLIALLTGFTVYALLQADRLAEERDEADAQRAEAEHQRSRAARISDFWLKSVLRSANAHASPDPNVKFKDLLRARAPDIDRRFQDLPEVAANLHHEFARLWQSLSSMPLAARHLERARDLRREHLGPEHSQTLSAMNDLASVYEVLGRRAEATALYEEVLAVRRRLFEPSDDQKLLTSINNMGFILAGQGRHEEAEVLLEEALKRRRRALGETHFQTLSTKNNLATIYVARDELDRAEPLLREVLRERRRQLREHDPKIFRSVANLARLLIQKGAHGEAEALLLPARERATKVLGTHHLMTLDLLASLARLRRAQGRRDLDLRLTRTVFERSREVTGPDSPSTLKAMFKLARSHEFARDFVRAAKVLEELLRLHKRATPRTSSAYLEVYRAIAVIHANLGSWKRARRVLDEGLEFLGEELPDDHPTMLMLRGTLGTVYRRLGDLDAAEDLLEQAYQGLRRVEGDADERTLLVLVGLAQLRLEMDRFSDAERAASKAFDGLVGVRSLNHPNTLMALRTLATACQRQNKFAEAEGHLKVLAEAFSTIMKQDVDIRAITMIDRANCLRELGRLQESELLFRQADDLIRDREIHPALNGDAARRTLYEGMAKTLEALDRSEEAATWRSRLAAVGAER